MLNNGVFYLVSFSFLTGFGSYFVKTIQGLNPQQIPFYRAILASLFLFAIALATNKLKELKFIFPINTVIMGLTQGLSIYFYYLALERTTIANAVFLVYTAPIFSIILAAIFLHEKNRKKNTSCNCFFFYWSDDCY